MCDDIQSFNGKLIEKWDKCARLDDAEKKYGIKLCTMYEMCIFLMKNTRCEECFSDDYNRNGINVNRVKLHENVFDSLLLLLRCHRCLTLSHDLTKLWYEDVIYISGRYIYLNLKNIFKFSFKRFLSLKTLGDVEEFNNESHIHKIDFDDTDETILATKVHELNQIGMLLIYAKSLVPMLFRIDEPEEFSFNYKYTVVDANKSRKEKQVASPNNHHRTIFNDCSDEEEKTDDD